MGRILALDYGTRRVGAAITDRARTLASPLEVYQRRSESHDARHYHELTKEEGVERIVVGLPVHTSGRESESSRQARKFGEWIEKVTGVRVVFFDERYTTVEADEMLGAAGLRGKARDSRRDMMAAYALLCAYLDAGCPESLGEPGALTDEH